MKQRLEKYSERFDNDKSAIGNPKTWGKRMVDEKESQNLKNFKKLVSDEVSPAMKEFIKEKETLEEAAANYVENFAMSVKSAREIGFIDGAKWQQERSYSEEEVKSAFKIGFNIGYGSPVQELDLKNEHCEKWFKQFKNK